VSSMPTMHIQAFTAGTMLKELSISTPKFGTTTDRVSVVRKKLSSQLEKNAVQRMQFPHIEDRWLIATLVIACVASLLSTLYVCQHHLVLIYNDSLSHSLIARSVIDSATPGLSQLGGNWLPLPHLLMLPFIWNDYLWTTGIAGIIVGTGCYLLATVYIFLAARRLTKSSVASFIGTMVFVLNPNVLYLQSTPLTEPVCWVTFTMACYYLMVWAQEDKRRYLLLAAASTCLATLARYDGWVLAGIFPIMIIATGLLKKQTLRNIEGNIIVFSVLGNLGISLWLIWGKIIFGDPLFFIRGSSSSQAQTMSGIQGTMDNLVRHNLITDVRLYSIDTVETMGIGLTLLAIIALLLFVVRRWKAPDTLAVLSFLAPFVFYCAALYGGQVNLFYSGEKFYPLGLIPFSEGYSLFNARFGSEMIAPAAIFIATLIPTHVSRKVFVFGNKWSLAFIRVVIVLIIVSQSIWVARGGVISIIASANPPFCVQSYSINLYLQQHYNGGRILHAEFPFLLSESESDIRFSNVVYERSGGRWQQALHNPGATVDWVIFTHGDTVSKAVKQEPDFLQKFSLVAVGPSTGSYQLKLYHKNGLSPLPTRPISSYLLNEQHLCSSATYKH